jgi:nucleoside-diphosphate-sugar epimerase
MKILVTGSAGHLGEAPMRMLPSGAQDAIGVDLLPPHTRYVGSIADRAFVARCMDEVDAVRSCAGARRGPGPGRPIDFGAGRARRGAFP